MKHRKNIFTTLLMSIFAWLFMASALWGAQSNIDVTGTLTVKADAYTQMFGPSSTLKTSEGTIVIAADGTGTNAQDSGFVQGGGISITLPEGYEFVMKSDQSTWPVSGSNMDVESFASAFEITAGGSLFNETKSVNLSKTSYVDRNNITREAVTSVSIFIEKRGTVDSAVTFDMNSIEGVGTQQLTVRPIPCLTCTPPNGSDLPVTVTVNSSTSSAVSTTLPSISMVTTPKLVSAVAVGSDALDLRFNTEINSLLPTDDDGNGFDVTDFDADGWNGGTQAAPTDLASGTLTVDASDRSLVHITNLSAGFDTDGTDFITVGSEEVVQSALAPYPQGAGENFYWVPILPSDAAVSSVILSRSTVGTNEMASAWGTYEDVVKGDATNKLIVTFNVSAEIPFDFRIVNTTTSKTVGFDLTEGSAYGCEVNVNDTGNVIVGELNESGSMVTGNTDTNVVRVASETNGSGLVQLDLAFADFDDNTGSRPDHVNYAGVVAVTHGSEGTFVVQASVDGFNTYTSSQPFTIDRKAPGIVARGLVDKNPMALSRTQIQLQFDEELNRASAERVFCDDNGNGLKDANEEYVYRLQNVSGSDEFIEVTEASLGSDNKTVTLTTDLIPVGNNCKIFVNGRMGDSDDNAATDPGHDSNFLFGVMDAAGNYVEDDTATANSSIESTTFQVSGECPCVPDITNHATSRQFIADGGTIAVSLDGPANLITVVARAVDPANKSTILSSNSSTNLLETSTGKYTGTVLLATGIDASEVIVQISTDPTFATNVMETDPMTVDNTSPTVVSAEYVDENSVKVTYSEAVLVPAAQTTGNYLIEGLQVEEAFLDLVTEKTVTLTTTSMTPGSSYTLDLVGGVMDLAGNSVNYSADTMGIDQASFIAADGETKPMTAATSAFTIKVGQTVSTKISGGIPPYTVSTSHTVGVSFDTDLLTITGNGVGSSTIIVSDSASDSVAINVVVKEGALDLIVTPSSASVKVGETTDFIASGVEGTLTASSDNEASATVTVSDSTITVTGVAAGTAAVTVSDDVHSVAVEVTVVKPAGIVDPPTNGNFVVVTGNYDKQPAYLGDVSTGGDHMGLFSNFPAYTGAVDHYIAILLPEGSGFFFIDADKNLSVDFAAYATGATNAVSETIFPEFQVCTPFGPAVPVGEWMALWLTVPSNGGDFLTIDWNGYQLGISTINIPKNCPGQP